MEDIWVTLEKEKVLLWIAFFMGLSGLIKTIFELGKEWLAAELKLKQRLRHERLTKEHQIGLASQDAKLRSLENSSLIKDINKIDTIIDNIRVTYSLERLNVAHFHNGINKHYRNFSTRYESVRDGLQPIFETAKPLKPFYNDIQKFIEEEYLIFKRDNSSPVVQAFLNANRVNTIYTFPMLIHASEDLDKVYKVHAIEINEECYYVLGTVNLYADDLELSDIDIAHIQQNVQEIINTFLNNNAVFG